MIGFVTSISSQTDVRAVPARWVPRTFTLDSYRQLLGGTNSQQAGGTVTEAGVYQHALMASTEVAVLATALTLMVATMAAYAFGRLRFRLGRMLFVAVLSTMLVPVFVVAVTLFQVMADLRLIDTKRGLTIVFVATLTPLATWLLYNHVREMDIGPEEAALVDGCRRWQAFWRVVVPQMGSAIAAVAAITALSVWGEFLIPLAPDVDRQRQARDRPDHRIRRQVHDQLPDRGRRRRARTAAAGDARAAPQPAHHQRHGRFVVIRHLGYTRERLAQMSQRLRERIYAEVRPADSAARERARRPDLVGGRAGARVPAGAVIGERFGPLWATYWFRVCATVPEEWRGRRVDLLFVSQSEAALWRDGRVVQGLNTGGDGERPTRCSPAPQRPGRSSLEIELACNGMFGEKPEPAELRRCDIALFDEEAWQLFFDFETLRALEAETSDAAWSGRLRQELNRFCNEGDPAILHALSACHNATHSHELAAIGHAHIDTAWLWPLAETYRKTLRSFSSQLRYMEDYPEYRFACSQAQQYAWVKERNPDLWQRIRAAVGRGQFVPVGGSWVEPDCNLPCGRIPHASVPARPALVRGRVRPPPPRVLESRRIRLRRPVAADPARMRHVRASSRRSSRGTASTGRSTTR